MQLIQMSFIPTASLLKGAPVITAGELRGNLLGADGVATVVDGCKLNFALLRISDNKTRKK